MNLSTFLSRLSGVDAQHDGWITHCPAHGDADPSLRVAVGKNGDRVMVKCRAGCETSAVMDSLGLTMADLTTMEVDGAARRVKRAISTDERPEPGAIASLRVTLDEAEAGSATAARAYASDRFGVDADTFERLGLGEMDERLVVPFYDAQGVALGYQARAIDPDVDLRWKGPKRPEGGGSWAKHGFFHGNAGWGEVIVAEGPGDGLTAAAMGYDVAFIAGAGNARNTRILDDIAEFAGGRKIIVAGDGDRAGREFSSAVSRGLIDRDCVVAVLDVPEGDDLTSWRERDPSGRSMVRAIVEAEQTTSFRATMTARDASLYPLTDLGNARFLRDYARAQGSALRYSPEAGFFVLDNGVWRVDGLDTARAFAQEAAVVTASIASDMMAAAMAVATPDPDEVKIARAWMQHATHSQSTRGIDASIRETKALRDVATNLGDFDKRDDLIAARNGVVDLRTGALLPHDPAYLLTRRVDIDYHADAEAPRWEQFLVEVFPNDSAMPAYMQRLIGYGITGRTDEQCFAIHWGGGANGKSVFTDTLTEVFREATVTTPFSTFEQKPSGGIPNDIASLKGARLVMASEGDAGKPMAEAMLKRITGRDLIAARFMRKEFFEFRPTFLLMLATNNKPVFKGQDEGLWRRVKLIEWARYFAPHERDPLLGGALMREREGIFTWAVRGAVEWYANGLGDPASITEATKDYRGSSNALDGFLPGVYEMYPDAAENGGTLYEAYREWADAEGLQSREVWTRRTFYGALEERGVTKHKRNTGVVFIGIRKAPLTRAASAPVADSSPVTTNSGMGASLDANV